MFGIFKLFYFVWKKGLSILNPSVNSMRNAPLHIKYFATILLGLFWSLAFCLYTAQFFYIGLNMIAHMAIISMIFITWMTLKGFRRSYPDVYPLQRDPNFSPKCYEMTDTEKNNSVDNADHLLDQQHLKNEKFDKK